VSLTAHLAHESEIARIRFVDCRPDDPCCGPEEHASKSTLVLPLRGVFIKHYGHRADVVADVCHGVFFNAGEPYRVSHPLDGGDECLAIEPSRDVLHEIVAECGERTAKPEEASFGHTHVQLGANLMAARKSLRHRLARRLAGPLEADETALQLLVATTRAAFASRPIAARGRQRTHARHQEIVDATKIALVSQPAQQWTLATLAKRVYSSPFHLARTFRRCAGMSLHRYHFLARMAAALDQVVDTSRDLAAIGVDLGFSSHSHFTAAFRTCFGLTPSTLRRSANARQADELRKILTAPKTSWT
jgi:AraC family transcriptional regulator